MKIEFSVLEAEEYSVVHFSLNEPLSPQDLKTIELPTVKPTKGVILSGRGPIWFYCFLSHYYHPTLFIATYDPRLGGAVVVESHSKHFQPGQLITLEMHDQTAE